MRRRRSRRCRGRRPPRPRSTISGSRCSSRGCACARRGRAAPSRRARASRVRCGSVGGLAQPGVERLGDRRARADRGSARRLWKLMPLPTMNTPSSRSGASARPIARCSAGSSPRLQRQLHRRHVGVGVGELERHERAVVEAALARPRRSRSPPRPSSCAHARRQRGIAGRRPGDLVRLGREAVVVVEHRRARGGHHRRHRLFPVRRDHEQRLGRRRRQRRAPSAGSRPARPARRVVEAHLDERPGAAAVGQEDDRHARRRGRRPDGPAPLPRRGIMFAAVSVQRRQAGGADAADRRRRSPCGELGFLFGCRPCRPSLLPQMGHRQGARRQNSDPDYEGPDLASAASWRCFVRIVHEVTAKAPRCQIRIRTMRVRTWRLRRLGGYFVRIVHEVTARRQGARFGSGL